MFTLVLKILVLACVCESQHKFVYENFATLLPDSILTLDSLVGVHCKKKKSEKVRAQVCINTPYR